MNAAEIREMVRVGTRDGRDRDFYAFQDEDNEVIIDGSPLSYWAVRSAGEWGSGEIARVHQAAHAHLLAASLDLARTVLDLHDRLAQVTEERDALRRAFCPPLFDLDGNGQTETPPETAKNGRQGSDG